MTARVLPLRFFHRSAPEVARDLIGAVVVSTLGGLRVTARIVETEAYLGREDPASHAWRGRRNRQNESIYSPPGTWYVYRSYGIHWCANLVCGPPGAGAAVLLRGVLPLTGDQIMAARRGLDRGARRLADGPGKLCQALGITRALDGRPMRGSPVQTLRGVPVPDEAVTVTPRIGITRAADWPLRFVVAASTRRP